MLYKPLRSAYCVVLPPSDLHLNALLDLARYMMSIWKAYGLSRRRKAELNKEAVVQPERNRLL